MFWSRYSRSTLKSMAAKTDGSTDNLTDGKHKLPAEAVSGNLEKRTLDTDLETQMPRISAGGISDRYKGVLDGQPRV